MSHQVNRTHFSSDERCVGGALMLQQQFVDMYTKIRCAKKVVDDNPPKTSIFRRSYFNKMGKEPWQLVPLKPNHATSKVDCSEPDSFAYLKTLYINQPSGVNTPRKGSNNRPISTGVLSPYNGGLMASASPRGRLPSSAAGTTYETRSVITNSAAGTSQQQRVRNGLIYEKAKATPLEAFVEGCDRRREELRLELARISARRQQRQMELARTPRGGCESDTGFDIDGVPDSGDAHVSNDVARSPHQKPLQHFSTAVAFTPSPPRFAQPARQHEPASASGTSPNNVTGSRNTSLTTGNPFGNCGGCIGDAASLSTPHQLKAHNDSHNSSSTAVGMLVSHGSTKSLRRSSSAMSVTSFGNGGGSVSSPTALSRKKSVTGKQTVAAEFLSELRRRESKIFQMREELGDIDM